MCNNYCILYLNNSERNQECILILTHEYLHNIDYLLYSILVFCCNTIKNSRGNLEFSSTSWPFLDTEQFTKCIKLFE